MRPAGNRSGVFIWRPAFISNAVPLGAWEWPEAAKAMPEDDWEDYSDNEDDDTTLMHDDGEDE